ncbi:MAG: DUF6644 family protein [Vicinamibacterales bacterium]
MNNDVLWSLVHAIEATAVHDIVSRSTWMWAVLESLHFIGLSVLIGTVGMFDLRLLGFARGVSVVALHRLIPLGIAAFALNATTGMLFLSGFPDQYIFNAAFRVKMALVLLAGVNVLFFYGRVFRRLESLRPDEQPPLAARIVGGVSLSCWIGVMCAGRLLTFFRPPF